MPLQSPTEMVRPLDRIELQSLTQTRQSQKKVVVIAAWRLDALQRLDADFKRAIAAQPVFSGLPLKATCHGQHPAFQPSVPDSVFTGRRRQPLHCRQLLQPVINRLLGWLDQLKHRQCDQGHTPWHRIGDSRGGRRDGAEGHEPGATHLKASQEQQSPGELHPLKEDRFRQPAVSQQRLLNRLCSGRQVACCLDTGAGMLPAQSTSLVIRERRHQS